MRSDKSWPKIVVTGTWKSDFSPLFGKIADAEVWDAAIRAGGTEREHVKVADDGSLPGGLAEAIESGEALPLAVRRGGALRPAGGDTLRPGDELTLLRMRTGGGS